jgi:hypothetical protein
VVLIVTALFIASPETYIPKFSWTNFMDERGPYEKVLTSSDRFFAATINTQGFEKRKSALDKGRMVLTIPRIRRI